ncbi:MAG: FCD domain-containing protein [Mogibacterium sp.]|nr:FCD domain-containing protein [Mogibacterium sp.]
MVSDPLGILRLNDDKVSMDIAEISILIQPYAAALAAKRRTPEDLEELRQVVEEYQREWSRYREGRISYPEMRRIDSRFHAIIIRCCRNVVMDRFNAAMEEFSDYYRENRSDLILQDNYTMHPLILDAIERGDAEEASALMLKHLHRMDELLHPKKKA